MALTVRRRPSDAVRLYEIAEMARAAPVPHGRHQRRAVPRPPAPPPARRADLHPRGRTIDGGLPPRPTPTATSSRPRKWPACSPLSRRHRPHARDRRRCRFHLNELRYEYPDEVTVPARPRSRTGATDLGRRCRAIRTACRTKVRATAPRTRADRGAGLRAVFPHRPRHRRLRAQPGHPVPGPRLGRQLGGVLLLGITSGRSVRIGVLFEHFISGSATSRRTSTSISSTSGARK